MRTYQIQIANVDRPRAHIITAESRAGMLAQLEAMHPDTLALAVGEPTGGSWELECFEGRYTHKILVRATSSGLQANLYETLS